VSRSIRKRLTFANVAACLALFLALGGTAAAANHYVLTSTKQVSPKVLKALKGKAGKAGKAGAQGVAGPAGTAGAKGATGAKGDAGTAGAKGDAGLAGAKGDAGDQGDQGDTGPRGPSDAATLAQSGTIANLADGIGSPSNVLFKIMSVGDYLVSPSVVLVNGTGTAASVTCIVYQSGGVATPFASQTIPVPANGQATLIMQVPVTIGSNIMLFGCADAGGTVSALDAQLATIKVATLNG
jgi:hypothetical protein